MMHTFAPTIAYQSVDLSDTHIDEASFTRVFSLLFPYRTVNVFYGKFQSIATQHAVMSTLNGNMGTDTVDVSKVSSKKQLMYLYEPSLKAVSGLFGREINASVFNQILQESQLAKHASRMMHLDEAIEQMDETLKGLNKQKRSSWKKIVERKQQSRLAGLFARGDV
jgi:F0F1-type ATP synthase gamma subunit